MSKSSTTPKDPYAVVTDTIIAHLEKGVVPWRKPWNVETGMPRSIDGRFYKGINVMLLGLQGYSDPRWGTFKALQAKGGTVKKGEKGTFVVFFKMLVSKTEVDAKGQPKKIPLLKYFYVFNVTQCDWTEPLDSLPDTLDNHHDPEPWDIAAASIHQHYEEFEGGPSLSHGGTRASYSPALDVVQMPEVESFDSLASYFHTQYHELVHSTGHESRLNRVIKNSFGTDPYAREELTAEMGAAFLGTVVGLPDQTEPSASYIQSWLGALRNDKKLVVSAASRAQKAVEHILGSQDAPTETEA